MTTPRPRLLVVEDDLRVLEGLIAGLSRAGFDVSVAMDGAEGARRALHESFEAVILDLMLPEKTGFEVLRALSGRTSVPVLVLSARSELSARIESFQLGAVDFVPKPFWIEELVARLRLRLGLVDEKPRRVIRFGSTEVDLDGRRVLREGLDLGLTSHEFNTLAWLLERPGRAVSRRQLADGALDEEGDRHERTVDSHLSRVRKKLGEDAAWIKTVWGIGYRFDPVEGG